MGARSRRKGARGEREAAAQLRRLFGVEARRGRQYRGTSESPDIATAIPKVHFEVKRVESLRLCDALDQAKRDSGSSIPVVLHRTDRRPWVAVVQLEDLPQLNVIAPPKTGKSWLVLDLATW